MIKKGKKRWLTAAVLVATAVLPVALPGDQSAALRDALVALAGAL